MSSDRSYSMRGITGLSDLRASDLEISIAQLSASQLGSTALPMPLPLPRRRTPASSMDPFHSVTVLRAYIPTPHPLDDVQAPAGRTLQCDLSSPLTVGAEACYRLDPVGTERSSADRLYAYQWTVRRRDDGFPLWQTITTAPEVRIVAAAPGEYRVEVVVLLDGAATAARVSLDQDVEHEPAELTAGLRGANDPTAQAMRELTTDLRGYILEAAAATGPHGISARFLASVLFIEILNRPRAVRERELDDLDRLLEALARGERVLFPIGMLDRALGVGQIRPAMAAMVTGATPWVEQTRRSRRPERDQVKAAYDALPLEAKQAIFTRLRWPRSNIMMAARLLCALKNRPNRYPTLTRAQLAADSDAIGVLATEYGSGAAPTPAASARLSGYGRWVWDQMHDPLVQQLFPDE